MVGEHYRALVRSKLRIESLEAQADEMELRARIQTLEKALREIWGLAGGSLTQTAWMIVRLAEDALAGEEKP